MIGEHRLGVEQIQPEMEAVFAKLQTWIDDGTKTHLGNYLSRLGVDPLAPPAFVLYSARLFNGTESAILPAQFLVLVHLAMTLHNIPRQIQGRDRQVLVLEGDYLYAHLLLLLCQTGRLNLLERLSRLIREMNEGSVLRRLQEQQGLPLAGDRLEEILGKQYGCFFAECCELGGLFAGQGQQNTSLLHRFGSAFGIAYGAAEAGLGPDTYRPLLDRSLAILDTIPALTGKNDLVKYAQELVIAPENKKFRVAV